jgi:Domain of Unknown Function (DUF1080)
MKNTTRIVTAGLASIGLMLASAFTLTMPVADNIEPAAHRELFNGKDFTGNNFTGWTFCMRSNAAPSETWTVTNGVIHCTGHAIGYVRTMQSYHDYKLTVEWRFVKVVPKADNTGILVHMQSPDQVWPPNIQVQGKHDHQGDLIFMAGAESKEHKGMDASTPVPMRGESVEKPVGEWNTCETICSSNKVTAYINGKLLNEATECTISSGFIGFQSEGADFEIRKVSLDPLPK